MKLTLPTYEATPEEEVLDEHGLSKEVARKLHAAACQGQVGKAWNKCDRHLPPKSLRKFGQRQGANSSLMQMLLLHQWRPKVGIPRWSNAPLSSTVGGWTTESAKAVFLLPHLPALWTAWLTRIAQLHPEACQARTWHAHKLVCLKNPAGGPHPILISSVWIKMISRLLLKEAGAPLKELVKDIQFGVGVPHGGLALLTKARSHLHTHQTHVAAQLDFQNAFGIIHRKACIAQLEKHRSSQEPWLLATKNLWSRNVAIPHAFEEDVFETSDGVPQGILYQRWCLPLPRRCS